MAQTDDIQDYDDASCTSPAKTATLSVEYRTDGTIFQAEVHDSPLYDSAGNYFKTYNPDDINDLNMQLNAAGWLCIEVLNPSSIHGKFLVKRIHEDILCDHGKKIEPESGNIDCHYCDWDTSYAVWLKQEVVGGLRQFLKLAGDRRSFRQAHYEQALSGMSFINPAIFDMAHAAVLQAQAEADKLTPVVDSTESVTYVLRNIADRVNAWSRALGLDTKISIEFD